MGYLLLIEERFPVAVVESPSTMLEVVLGAVEAVSTRLTITVVSLDAGAFSIFGTIDASAVGQVEFGVSVSEFIFPIHD